MTKAEIFDKRESENISGFKIKYIAALRIPEFRFASYLGQG